VDSIRGEFLVSLVKVLDTLVLGDFFKKRDALLARKVRET